jgi:hypothetical protein
MSLILGFVRSNGERLEASTLELKIRTVWFRTPPPLLVKLVDLQGEQRRKERLESKGMLLYTPTKTLPSGYPALPLQTTFCQ